MSKGKILVTPRSLTRAPHPAIDLLSNAGFEVVTGRPGQQPSEEELLELLPDCRGYLAGVEPISARVLNATKNLVAISRNGVGIDNIDLEAAEEAGISILTTPGANSEGVAELTIGLILALVRSLPYSDRTIKKGEWNRKLGFELQGATLGIIGCGNIGKRVAELVVGFGMKVLGFDPFPTEGFNPEGFTWTNLNNLFSSSKIVTLHAPATEKPVVDMAALEQMPSESYIVNTARSALVDKEAVLASLDKGKLAGYAVDAYDTEPPTDRRLVEHEKVIATAHIGGYTKESVYRAAMGAAENILEELKER